MEKEMTISEFVKRFNDGDFNYRHVSVQIEAGWWDLFCNDSALCSKTKTMGRKVESIMNSKRFDKDKCYVFFKNNCPCVGPLYDQFSICDIESCHVLYCCQHLEKGSHGCDHAHWEVYGRENEFKTPLIEGTWNEVKKWFNA